MRLARIDKLMGELMSVIDASERFAANRIGIKRDKEADVTPIATESAPPAATPADPFGEEMRRNLETRERLKRERADANKAVLRSYRIKS